MIPRWLKRRGCSNIHVVGCTLLFLVIYKVWYSALIPDEYNLDRDNPSLANDDQTHHKKAHYRYKRYAARNQVNEGLPGELGAAVVLDGKDKALADSLFKKEAFNIIASNRIALNRTLKDLRDPS